jgi:hypothetical protein
LWELHLALHFVVVVDDDDDVDVGEDEDEAEVVQGKMMKPHDDDDGDGLKKDTSSPQEEEQMNSKPSHSTIQPQAKVNGYGCYSPQQQPVPQHVQQQHLQP